MADKSTDNKSKLRKLITDCDDIFSKDKTESNIGIVYQYNVISFCGKHEYQVINPFLCQECGRCCNPMLKGIWNRSTIHRVAANLGYAKSVKGRAKFVREHLGTVHEVYEDGFTYTIGYAEDRTCPFLSPDNKCLIYPFRPKACVEFPSSFNYGMARVGCPASTRMYKAFCEITKWSKCWYSSGMRRVRSKDKMNERISLLEKPDGKRWNSILKKYKRINPSDKELCLFLKLNDRLDA